ncbi:GNAT family N-acetyltransferase [Zooshikella marina]|uniref:GNAT family N-acetyltransferase n=1 Tax=Zooshikella ganghwensis TaxID=202772 RepID=UPI0012FAE251|nr:GNAT family N-acetyltransferase [Zooshikella ganghwensis]MBU2704488.1 GNAT family N-acetyltransferase [Zooshikella ganghwensis]
MQSNYRITQGNWNEAMQVISQLPEFERDYSIEVLAQRVANKAYSLLIAWYGERPVAFKLGYALDDDRFYSWLEGVIPAYRELGIGTDLLVQQEAWALNQGYSVLEVKSRNCFPKMLRLLLKQGYFISHVEPQGQVEQHIIYFSKSFSRLLQSS